MFKREEEMNMIWGTEKALSAGGLGAWDLGLGTWGLGLGGLEAWACRSTSLRKMDQWVEGKGF